VARIQLRLSIIAVPVCFLLCGCAHFVQKHGTPANSPIAALKPGLFEDAAERAGIHFRHTNGEPMRYPFLQTVGGGCAFLDYDQDGWQDILLLSPGEFETASPKPTIALYHNNGNGTFTDVTIGSGLDKPLGYGQGPAVGDFDNDGFPDVFIAGYGGCHLFRNLGAGGGPHAAGSSDPRPVFEDVTATAGVSDTEQGPRWAMGAVWGDFDGDGRIDLYVCHYAPWTPATDKKCSLPDGSFMFCSPLVYPGDKGRLYHNEGGGRFKDVTESSGIGKVRARQIAAAWLDFNGDGNEDLFVTNDLDPNFLFRNNGNGTFTEVALQTSTAYGGDGAAFSGMGVAVGDYDHSGRESLFIPNLSGQVYALYRNLGSGSFEYATDEAGLTLATMAHSGWGVAFLDFDRDGWADLIAANGHVNPFLDRPGVIQYREPIGLYHNVGGGKFADFGDKSGPMARLRSSRGLAVGDFDNDGRMDVLCISRNETAELFRNVSGDKNHWISLSLVGVRGNRDGAGAKVWITAGGVRQYAECRLGSSYASCSDKRLFFGLKDSAVVDKIELGWPGGAKEVYKSLKADTFYAVTEGKGYVVRQ
jgi:hypothetical protein